MFICTVLCESYVTDARKIHSCCALSRTRNYWELLLPLVHFVCRDPVIWMMWSTIWGSHCSECKYGCLLGCCNVYSSRSLPTFEVPLLPPSSGPWWWRQLISRRQPFFLDKMNFIILQWVFWIDWKEPWCFTTRFRLCFKIYNYKGPRKEEGIRIERDTSIYGLLLREIIAWKCKYHKGRRRNYICFV